MKDQSQSSSERVILNVSEVAKMLGISRGSAYEAIRRRQIPCIRIGRRVLVPKKALDRFLDSFIMKEIQG